MRTIAMLALAVLILCPVGTLATGAPKKTSAKVAYKAIQKAATKPAKNADLLKAVFPEKLVSERRDWKEEDTRAWREGYAARFAKAKLVSVTESEDRAVVRFQGKAKKTDLMVRLRHDGERWVVDCPDVYLVKGRILDLANAGGPARVTIKARQKNGEYEGSAYSFAHVTSDPELCKNRMDVWFCKHGDLHTSGKDRLAVVGLRKPLDKVDGIDATWEWKRHVAPVAGTTYALHCLRSDHRDFYVKFKVVEVSAKSLTLEWEVLAAGTGSPTSIQKPQPLESRDGADGHDGMCGGKM